jgi:hypothetical protein
LRDERTRGTARAAARFFAAAAAFAAFFFAFAAAFSLRRRAFAFFESLLLFLLFFDFAFALLFALPLPLFSPFTAVTLSPGNDGTPVLVSGENFGVVITDGGVSSPISRGDTFDVELRDDDDDGGGDVDRDGMYVRVA